MPRRAETPSRSPFQRSQIKDQTFKKTLHQSPSEEDHGLRPALPSSDRQGRFWMREATLSAEELKLNIKSFMGMGDLMSTPIELMNQKSMSLLFGFVSLTRIGAS